MSEMSDASSCPAPEGLQIRVSGDARLPTLIYLPGLHGDWTLVGDFRRAIAGRVRFVEFTYPRTITWTLDDYAAAIEKALAQHGIVQGWLLGESYGSQILWAMAARKQFPVQGLILAGGFVQHPWRWGVRLVQSVFGRIPGRLLIWMLFSYAKIARIRYRHSPETRVHIDEFIVRRTEPDRRAALHRLEQIAGNDPRKIAVRSPLPLYYLSGWLDPIVPWPLVRKWLRQNCPALRECKIIRTADHNVLGTAPKSAAEEILRWVTQL